jgi:hypothetical protein
VRVIAASALPSYLDQLTPHILPWTVADWRKDLRGNHGPCQIDTDDDEYDGSVQVIANWWLHC